VHRTLNIEGLPRQINSHPCKGHCLFSLLEPRVLMRPTTLLSWASALSFAEIKDSSADNSSNGSFKIREFYCSRERKFSVSALIRLNSILFFPSLYSFVIPVDWKDACALFARRHCSFVVRNTRSLKEIESFAAGASQSL
jgi:hypothetical protein